MKIAIYGAYGLVGSNLCKTIQREDLSEGIEITRIKCDEFIFSPMGEVFDAVIYAAGYGQPQLFGKDKVKTIEINTTSLIESFKWLKPSGKFLFISSSEVYSGAPSPHKETDIGTTNPQHPRACYIEGKRCGEAICMAYKEQGYDVKIARLALAYGPGTKPHDTRVLNQFVEQALTSGEIKLRDKGEAIRTYGYIDDVVTQLLSILFEGKDVVYNVGGDSTLSISNLARRIATETNSTLSFGDASLEGAPEDVKLDMSKTLTEFPMTLTPIYDGLKKTIEYQKTLYEA